MVALGCMAVVVSGCRSKRLVVSQATVVAQTQGRAEKPSALKPATAGTYDLQLDADLRAAYLSGDPVERALRELDAALGGAPSVPRTLRVTRGFFVSSMEPLVWSAPDRRFLEAPAGGGVRVRPRFDGSRVEMALLTRPLLVGRKIPDRLLRVQVERNALVITADGIRHRYIRRVPSSSHAADRR